MSDARNVSQLVQVCARALVGVTLVASGVFACSGSDDAGATIDGSGGAGGGGGNPATTSMGGASTTTGTTAPPPI